MLKAGMAECQSELSHNVTNLLSVLHCEPMHTLKQMSSLQDGLDSLILMQDDVKKATSHVAALQDQSLSFRQELSQLRWTAAESQRSSECSELGSFLDQERAGSKLLRQQVATLRAEQERAEFKDAQCTEVQLQAVELRRHLKRSETDSRELSETLNNEREDLRHVLSQLESVTRERDSMSQNQLYQRVQELQDSLEVSESEHASAKLQLHIEKEGAQLLLEQVQGLKRERDKLAAIEISRNVTDKKKAGKDGLEDMRRSFETAEAERKELEARLEQERCNTKTTALQLDATRQEREDALERLRKNEAEQEARSDAGSRSARKASGRSSQSAASSRCSSMAALPPRTPQKSPRHRTPRTRNPDLRLPDEAFQQDILGEASLGKRRDSSEKDFALTPGSKVHVNLVGRYEVDLQETPADFHLDLI